MDVLRDAQGDAPESAAVLTALADAELGAGNARQASVLLERAAALEPEAGQIAYKLALSYRQLGDVERAQTWLRRRNDLAPAIDDPLLVEVAGPDPVAQVLRRRGEPRVATRRARRGGGGLATRHRTGAGRSRTRAPPRACARHAGADRRCHDRSATGRRRASVVRPRVVPAGLDRAGRHRDRSGSGGPFARTGGGRCGPRPFGGPVDGPRAVRRRGRRLPGIGRPTAGQRLLPVLARDGVLRRRALRGRAAHHGRSAAPAIQLGTGAHRLDARRCLVRRPVDPARRPRQGAPVRRDREWSGHLDHARVDGARRWPHGRGAIDHRRSASASGRGHAGCRDRGARRPGDRRARAAVRPSLRLVAARGTPPGSAARQPPMR